MARHEAQDMVAFRRALQFQRRKGKMVVYVMRHSTANDDDYLSFPLFFLSFLRFVSLQPRSVITDNWRHFRVLHLCIDCFILFKNSSGYASSVD